MAQGRTFEDSARARELFGQGYSCNAIARELGVSASTISAWAKREGLSFDRTRTESATVAHEADAKALRVQLKLDLLNDALRLRQQMWEPARVINFGGKDNTLNETTLDEPTFADKARIMQAVGIAVDKFDRLDAKDDDGGAADGESLLRSLAEELGLTTVEPTDG